MSGVDIASDDVTSRRRYSEGYHEETGEDNRHEGSRGTRGEGRGDVGFNRGYSGEDDDVSSFFLPSVLAMVRFSVVF